MTTVRETTVREIGRWFGGSGGPRALPLAARPYIAGFGTSGSLLAVAALLFIVASAMVAFHGWPHVGAQPSRGEVVVSPQRTVASGSAVAGGWC